MLRAHKGQQKVPILKKTTGLCSSRSFYSLVEINSQSRNISEFYLGAHKKNSKTQTTCYLAFQECMFILFITIHYTVYVLCAKFVTFCLATTRQ